MVRLAGSGEGVAVPLGVGVGAGVDVIVTLDAVSEVAQLPVPVSVELSPTAGFAPDGLNVVEEFVNTSSDPQPVPALTENSVLLMTPVMGPEMVSVDPFCEYDWACMGEVAAGRLAPVCDAQAVAPAANAAASQPVRA